MGVFSTGLRYVFKDFSCWTSTHGVPHIGMANAIWLRTFWILVVLCCVGGFIWQLQALLHKYFAYLVNTETKLQFSERVFPTVTICHLNPWKLDEARNMDAMRDLIDKYEDKTADADYGFETGLKGERQRTATKWTSIFGERLFELDPSPGYAYEDLIVSCTYDAKTCNYSTFEPIRDSTYGICHKFNFNGFYVSSRAGPLYGLRLVLKVDQSQYLPWTEASGVVINIHAQDEVPYPDVLGYFAPPGTASSMGVRFLTTTRCPHPYGTCTTQSHLQSDHFDGNYAVEACFRSCLQAKIVAECGCYDPSYPHADGISSCSVDDTTLMAANMDCIEGVTGTTSSFNVIRDCSCPQPCEVETYSVTVSTAKWPSNAYTPNECNEKNNTKWLTKKQCVEWYRENTLLVEIYYERMNYQVLSESPAYSLVNLVSDIGGQVGLFLGMSIISLIEFAFLIILVCTYCATHKKRRVQMEDLDNARQKAKNEADEVANKREQEQSKREKQRDVSSLYDNDGFDPAPPKITNAD
ncbi:unnamed protein product [Auanema sp. JU1783]|nr:unnamed protein product [Auanema sp. JU1783]